MTEVPDIEQVLKNDALNQAFSFTLDMVAATQGQVPPALILENALTQLGYEVIKGTMSETDYLVAQAIPVHACRADRPCEICTQRGST
jgi:hypothetical protein